MMSNDSNPTPEENAPEINVSGIPTDYVVFDMSSMSSATSDEAPAEAEQPAEASIGTELPAENPVNQPEITVPTVEVVGIRFKSSGKVYYFDPRGTKATKGEHAIVETARGQEFGEIALENTRVPESEIVPPIRPMLRIATKEDRLHYEENKKKEDEAFRVCLAKIEAHKLDMKLVEAQYTFDNSKLLFYFTSAGRVDFRDLVKDLASVFRTRIELRQIGIRDEAKLIGGLGSCGRSLCCSGFLTDFGQVSIKMAKEQNLSLNSTKISGTCGRLMCCLRYEYETYLEEARLTPPVDSIVKTPDGIGTVVETAPLLGTVKVRLNALPEEAPRPYHRDTLTVYPRGKVPTEEEIRAAHAEARKAEISDSFRTTLGGSADGDTPRDAAPRHTQQNGSAHQRHTKDEQSAQRATDGKRQHQKPKKDAGAHPARENVGKETEESSGRNRPHGAGRQGHGRHGHRGRRPGGKPHHGGKGGSNGSAS